MTTSETYLLGCCLLDDGASLDKAIDAGLASTDFTAHGEIFAALRALRADGQPIGLDTLVPRLERPNLSELMALADPLRIGTSAHFEHHLRQVLDDSHRRRLIRATEELKEKAVAGAPIEELNAALADLTGKPTSARKDRIAALHSRRVRVSNPQPEPVTRLFLADKPISTPGNITTLISKAKTGKTATLGAATAAIIAATTQTLDRDTFKFRASNPNGHAVLVIDTEQSLYDAYLCYKRSLTRAGVEEDPYWLHHYSLVGFGPAQVKESLELAAEEAAAQHRGIFAIILDGVADLVASVNDEAECNGLVTWLRALATQYDCPIICVIHSNEAKESGDDGRGHLGKQLIRKAESNLLIKKSNDISIITSDKQRKAPITEADGVAFAWSEDHGMHILCDAPERVSPAGRKKLYTAADFMDIFPAPGAKPITGGQLHRMAMQVADIKPTTFKDLLTQATIDGVLIRTFDSKIGYSYVRAI